MYTYIYITLIYINVHYNINVHLLPVDITRIPELPILCVKERKNNAKSNLTSVFNPL